MEGALPRAAASELTAHRRPLGALTGIRFFAAFYVVVFHTRIAAVLSDHGHRAAGYFFGSGYLAVPLFFLLSGFILAYTYNGQIEGRGDYRRFWEARFARIWPVYAVSLLLSSVVSMTLPKPAVGLATLLMVQAWNPFNLGMAGAWNIVCWTLSAEALFYLCFPWIQIWLERRSPRMMLFFIGVMLLLCVATNSASRTLGSEAQGVYRWIPLAPLHLFEFIAGVGLGNYFLQRFVFASAGSGGAVLRGAGVWTYLSALATVGLLCRAPGRWTSLVVIGFSALIFGLAAERTLLSRFLSTKTMLLGGGISYSVYLMQMPVKSSVSSVAGHLHVRSEIVRMGLTMVVLLGVSFFLFKAVEDPARRVLRSFFAGLERGRSQAMATRD
ncbi:acyltransferase [Granulicella sp. L60]|uniref:acyltransferase family protein n=1 Tax=Granulicella sp. L60 TaxID=1641866 RepID=UPI00131E6F1D|nr:acyltransferase [Granulicella sp. L60]